MHLNQNLTDPESFVRLYEQYVERVYAYIVSRVKHVPDAEDLTSKIWEIILKELPRFKNKEEYSFEAWLFTICRNEVSHYFKKQGRTQALTDEVAALIPDPAKTPDQAYQSNESQQEIHTHLAKLSTQQQECIRLKYLADLKNKEIAAIQGISEKTVASNLVRALQNLKKSLQKLQ